MLVNVLWFKIIMLVVFFGYLGYIIIRYGVLNSISKIYYTLPDPWKRTFTAFCLILMLCTMVIGQSTLSFLAASALAFVGIAAEYKKKITDKVHFWGAGATILFSQLSIFFDFKMKVNYDLWWVNVLFIIASILIIWYHKKKNLKKATWWVESLGFILFLAVLTFLA